jgi:hypothetical protein
MTRNFLAFSCAAAALAAGASFAQTPSLAAGGAGVNGVQRQTVFKPKVGTYRTEAYASPSQPVPYDRLHAYLSASPGPRRAGAPLTGPQVAATAGSAEVSATVSSPAAHTDISQGIGVPAFDDPSLPSNGGGVIPDSIRRSALATTPLGGEVAVTVHDYGAAAPISPVQAELNRLGLSGTPNPAGLTAPAGEVLTQNGPVQGPTP